MPKGARIDGKIIMQEAPAKLKAVPGVPSPITEDIADSADA